MTERNVVTLSKANNQAGPTCNVSQKFNFTVGAIAVLAATAALVFLVIR